MNVIVLDGLRRTFIPGRAVEIASTNFGQVVLVATDPTDPLALSPLGLSNNTVQENTAAGTVIGALTGLTSGSSIALTTNDGNRVALSGTNIVVGATALDYETAGGLRSFSVTETLAGRPNSPNVSTIGYTLTNVFEAASLGILSFSATTFAVGTASSGTIVGATATSTIGASGLPSGLSINGPARTWAWSGSGSVGSGTITLTETLADSPNSPRTSLVAYSVVSAATPLNAPTLTRTSSAGASPVTFQVAGDSTEIIGMFIELEMLLGNAAATTAMFNAGAAAVGSNGVTAYKVYEIFMNGQEWEAGASTIPPEQAWVEPSGAHSERARLRTDPYDTANSIDSAWSAIIGDTVTASSAQWTALTGTKKSTWIGTPTNGGLTFQCTNSLGAYACIGSTIAGASKSQWELKIQAAASSGASAISFGRYNTTTNLGTLNARPGVADANGYTVLIPAVGTSTTVSIFRNSGGTQTNYTLSSAPAVSDVFTDELDISGAAGTHVLKVYRNSSQLVATISAATFTGFSTAWAASQSDETLTANFGGQAWVHALNTGFVPYG